MIGLVALIIFGPRKLPELMKSFGKAMAQFRSSTNEFKAAWEKEADLENISGSDSDKKAGTENDLENTISRDSPQIENQPVVPAITEVSGKDFEAAKELNDDKVPDNTVAIEATPAKEEIDLDSDKRSWL